jgi:hypothetical protein
MNPLFQGAFTRPFATFPEMKAPLTLVFAWKVGRVERFRG